MIPSQSTRDLIKWIGQQWITFGLAKDMAHLKAIEQFRASPRKNRPLKLSWEMDCLHIFYKSEAAYAMNENGHYFHRFAFFNFFEEFFCRHPENHRNRKLKQKLGVPLCLLKVRTFDEAT